MSVRALVYQQSLRCFCAPTFGAACWPHEPGEGSTNSVSPVPLTCVLTAGRSLVRSEKQTSRAAMGLARQCRLSVHARLFSQVQHAALCHPASLAGCFNAVCL